MRTKQKQIIFVCRQKDRRIEGQKDRWGKRRDNKCLTRLIVNVLAEFCLSLYPYCRSIPAEIIYSQQIPVLAECLFSRYLFLQSLYPVDTSSCRVFIQQITILAEFINSIYLFLQSLFSVETSSCRVNIQQIPLLAEFIVGRNLFLQNLYSVDTSSCKVDIQQIPLLVKFISSRYLFL